MFHLSLQGGGGFKENELQTCSTRLVSIFKMSFPKNPMLIKQEALVRSGPSSNMDAGPAAATRTKAGVLSLVLRSDTKLHFFFLPPLFHHRVYKGAFMPLLGITALTSV